MTRIVFLFVGFGLFLAVPAFADTAYSINVEQQSYAAGATIEASWTTATSAASDRDWVGVFEPSAQNTNYRDWGYIAGSTGSGVVELAESAPGTYELRLFKNNSYTLAATSDTFTVTDDDDPTDPDPVTYDLTVNTNTTEVGDVVTATWVVEGTTDTADDWVGLFFEDASNRSYEDWTYVDATTGSVSFTMPESGVFEFRYLIDNGYTAVATSEPITVTTDGDEPSGDTYSLFVPADEYEVGDAVSVSWDTDTTDSLQDDWIGLYRPTAADRSYLDWEYTGADTSGNLSFTLTDSGAYEFRYFKNNSYTLAATSDTFTVTDDDDPTDPDPVTYDLTVNTNTTEVGDVVTATWVVEGTTDTADDWVGLFFEDASNRSYEDWTYVDATTGSVSFTMPESGVFEFRYLIDNSYTDVATSDSITVTTGGDEPSGGYSVAPNNTTYDVGSTAYAIWDAPPGANTLLDWIGLYRPGTSDFSFLDYEYTDIFSNQEDFTLRERGTYEFRYFKNNSYQRVATSDPFEVVFDPLTCNGYDLDEVTNYPTDAGPVIALGNSITAGVGASAGEGYVGELQRRLNIDIINAGVPGDTTQDALARLEADVLSHNPSTVIVFIGGNDELRRLYQRLVENASNETLKEALELWIANQTTLSWEEVPLLTRTETFNNLSSIVTQIQDTGANTVIVGFDGYLFDNSMALGYQTIADNTGSLFIPDIYQDILGRPSRMSDLVHPNNIGYDIIADRIQLGLTCVLE